jgi:hypothetical protein
MKSRTVILLLALAASTISATAQVVMEEQSIMYFKTNVFLHDDTVNPLNTRVTGGNLPLLGGTMLGNIAMGGTNSILDANLFSANSITAKSNLTAKSVSIDGGATSNLSSVAATSITATVATAGRFVSANLSPTESTAYGLQFFDDTDSLRYLYDSPDSDIFGIRKYNTTAYTLLLTLTNFYAGVAASGETTPSVFFDFDENGFNVNGGFRVRTNAFVSGNLYVTNATAKSTNIIATTTFGGSIEVKGGDGTYPTTEGGDILLTPGTYGSDHGGVYVTRGEFHSPTATINVVYLQKSLGAYSAWLETDGTNLFFTTTANGGMTTNLSNFAP